MGALIKFIAAAIWICAVTLGAVFYSFQSAGAKGDAAPPLPLLGGLDYIKADIVSVPVMKQGHIDGYFLTRLVYMVEPAEMAKLSAPPESLIADEVYSYIYGNPQLDFEKHDTIDLDAYRKGLKEQINKHVGADFVQDVLVEQVDYLSKDEIRDNAIRRRMAAGATAREMAKSFKDQPEAGHSAAKPSH